MPTLPEIVQQLSVFVTTSATVAVLFTAGVIVVVKDWRASLLALSFQYVIVGLLLTSTIRMEVALIKTLVGAIISLILYMTARHVDWGRPAAPPPPSDEEDAPTTRWSARDLLPTELPFRLLAAILVMGAAYGGATSRPLPDVNEAINLSVYTLGALGLLAMGLTDEPLKAGLGLLTFVSAFELFYTVLEPSLIVVGFLGLSNFLIALAVAYLAVARTDLTVDAPPAREIQPSPGEMERFDQGEGLENA